MLIVHGEQEFLVGAGAFHAVLDELHGIDRVAVAQEATQYPHAVEGVLLEQQVVATSARRHNVDRGEDALVAELAVELQLHVAGTLEFLKDHLVHLAASLNEGCGDDGETASVLNVARSAKEALGTLQGIGVNTTTQNLATGRSDCIVGASQASD